MKEFGFFVVVVVVGGVVVNRFCLNPINCLQFTLYLDPQYVVYFQHLSIIRFMYMYRLKQGSKLNKLRRLPM